MIFLIICDLLIPVIMVLLGIVYKNHYPKEINQHHGYRTENSIKNQETWEFAQKTFRKIVFKIGIILLFISSIVIFLYKSRGLNSFSIFSIL